MYAILNEFYFHEWAEVDRGLFGVEGDCDFAFGQSYGFTIERRKDCGHYGWWTGGGVQFSEQIGNAVGEHIMN